MIYALIFNLSGKPARLRAIILRNPRPSDLPTNAKACYSFADDSHTVYIYSMDYVMEQSRAIALARSFRSDKQLFAEVFCSATKQDALPGFDAPEFWTTVWHWDIGG